MRDPHDDNRNISQSALPMRSEHNRIGVPQRKVCLWNGWHEKRVVQSRMHSWHNMEASELVTSNIKEANTRIPCPVPVDDQHTTGASENKPILEKEIINLGIRE